MRRTGTLGRSLASVMRSSLVVLLVASANGVPHGTPGGCVVQIDQTQSQSWSNHNSETVKHFSIRVKVLGQWPPFAHIRMQWPEPVTVQHMYDAEGCTEGCPNIIDVPDDDEQTVTALLGPEKHESMSILIQGTGSLVMPTVTCLSEAEWLKAPPPAPPHVDDCDMQPHYNIINAWDAGETVEITFGAWRENQMISLNYWGQTNLQIEQLVHASNAGITSHGSGTTIQLELGKSCHILQTGTAAPTDENGAVQRVINCVPETVSPTQQRLVQFQLKPPALHAPHIVCHDPWSPPPPPPSPPRSPPSPGPPPLEPSPPPPPMFVATDGASSMSGRAIVTSTKHEPDDMELRHIVVQLDNWRVGHVVTIGVAGYELDVTHSKYGT